jgi:ankyrin repeat protein
MLEFLLTLGLDVNECNQEGITPIIAACSEGIIDKIVLLIRHGANTTCELEYNSAHNLEEALEKQSEYERLQWMAVLQYIQPQQDTDQEQEQDELNLSHLGAIHNGTLSRMLMPFL